MRSSRSKDAFPQYLLKSASLTVVVGSVLYLATLTLRAKVRLCGMLLFNFDPGRLPQRELSVRRYSVTFVLALSTLLFVSTLSAQQATTAANASPSGDAQSGVEIDTVVNCTIAKNGYLPVFTLAAPPNITICNSAIFQANGAIGIGTTTPVAALDVVGAINSSLYYQILGTTVLAVPGYTAGRATLSVGAEAGGTTPAFTGDNDTFVGISAGNATTSGSFNVFVGHFAGRSNKTSDHNTFVGDAAGINSDAVQNTFLGFTAGSNNTSGTTNTATGYQAGRGNLDGHDNAYYGPNAGFCNDNNLTHGIGNTYLGSGAGSSCGLVNGSNNIFVGFGAGNAENDVSNNIEIGNSGPAIAGSNSILIGTPGTQTATYIAGIYGATSSGVPVYINSNGQLSTTSSSRRFKDQIRDMGDSSSRLLQLRPVNFLYKPEYDDGSHQLQFGLIAEEVAKVYPEMVAYDKDGQPFTVKYQLLAPMLLNELQKQHAVVMSQQEQLQTQLQQIKAQRQEIEGLKHDLQLQNASLQHRLQRLESYVETQMKTASDVHPATTVSANGGAQ